MDSKVGAFIVRYFSYHLENSKCILRTLARVAELNESHSYLQFLLTA